MAAVAGRRGLLFKLSPSAFLSSRCFASRSLSFPRSSHPLLRLRPLASAAAANRIRLLPAASGGSIRCFATRPTTSSLNDPSPNWSNRPPKETILLDGCDFEHWLVVMEPPDPSLTRDEIIDSYIKTLAQVLGSEEEARMSIYSVSTKHYFAFGAKVSEEISYKIKPLPKVRWVLPDSYLDVKNKDYGGEPFIDGKAVPYDPKYHEEWVRNNARAQERSRRNDRPRNFDRSRNFERRRENMQNFQNRDASPMANQEFQNRDAHPMSNSQNMPPRDFQPNAGPPNPSGMPNYQSQIPPQGNYAPNPIPGYQGNAHTPQGGPGGNPPGHPPYQGGSPAYQGGGQGYQGYHQGYQRGNPGYQGGGGPVPQGGNPTYQPGNPTGGYQPNYQGGSPNDHQQGVPTYQGRDYQ